MISDVYPIIKRLNAGCYIWTDPDDLSALKFKVFLNLFDTSNLDRLNSTEFHVTLMYATSDLPDKLEFKDFVFQGLPKRARVLGDYLVLELESPTLSSAHDFLLDQGFKHSFSGYIPHVSLGKIKEMNKDIVELIKEMNLVIPKIDFNCIFTEMKCGSLE